MIKQNKITLFDSFLRKKVDLDLEQIVKIYGCGPTVYNYQSIGNMRAIWLPDSLVKLVDLAGKKTDWVSNITDVGHLVGDGDEGEDKIEKTAKEKSLTAEKIVDFYTKDFYKQCYSLNFNLPTGKKNPKATSFVLQQAELALKLLKQDLAYLKPDGVYFDFLANLKKFKDKSVSCQLQAVLNKIQRDNQSNKTKFSSRQIVSKNSDRRDFAVWKFVSPQALQKWKFADFPDLEYLLSLIAKNSDKQQKEYLLQWGTPGWHTECVCMIREILG